MNFGMFGFPPGDQQVFLLAPPAGTIAYPYPALAPGGPFKQNAAYNAAQFYAPANDGTTIFFPYSDTGSLVLNSLANSAVWTNSYTTVNAAATRWVGFWYDTVEARIYCFARSGSTLYVGYITNFATGAVTAIGTGCAITANMVLNGGAYAIKRAQMGSGDFTVYLLNQNPATKISISSTTGAITVAEAAITQNGVNIAVAYIGFTSISADETAAYAIAQPINNSGSLTIAAASKTLYVIRNGRLNEFIIDFTPIGGLGFDTQAGVALQTQQWGNDVLAMGGVGASNTYLVGPRYFSRSSFEVWLNRLLTAAGAP
jgi:hypothetical protein